MWQVIGQDKVLALLDHSFKQNNIAHAYLLVGPPHVGKKTLALNLAQALNCDGSEPPCGQCYSCRRIIEGKHADVTSLELDSKVEIGIDEIRELQHLANLPPYEGKCKVFIIDDAEYLSTEAANSLLKILEEPPPRVVWLLLAVEEPRLLPTIISRCQRLELKPMPFEQIQQILIGSYNVDSDKAKLLARLCHGCLGWALSALGDEEILKRRSEKLTRLSSLTTASLEQKFAYARELATQFSQNRRPVTEVMEIWLSWWRDLMLIKGGCKEAITNIDYEVALENQAKSLTLNEIKNFLANLRQGQEEISKNVNPRLAFEWLMLKLPRKEISHV
jgi:DNA polymerase-3 subunit delta'